MIVEIYKINKMLKTVLPNTVATSRMWPSRPVEMWLIQRDRGAVPIEYTPELEDFV